LGFEAIAVPGDVRKEADVQAMVKQTVDHFGYVDILVNNAGRQFRNTVLDMVLDEWNDQLATFLTGAMLMIRECCRDMLAKQRRGAVINILSSAAHQGQPANSAYSCCKGGLLNFTRAAAMELAHHGIRVNAITPTTMEHNLARRASSKAAPAAPAASRTSFADARFTVTSEDQLRGIPMGRFCRTTDLAKAAVFLASDDAEMITGQDLRVDGGSTARFWGWIPGQAEQWTVEEYLETTYKHLEWGEEVPR
jgi:NAD(P)-dependent dehydrogenase (short-subunit alcohol dehydrogenase family)